MNAPTATGYLHPDYAASLAEFGTPRELPRCKGWILKRRISGFPYDDGMGCYPLFACQDWSKLDEDLEELRDELVALSLVADPFGGYDLPHLRRCFNVVIPFKEHYVTDLHQPMRAFVSHHHRRYALKSLRKISIEMCSEPMQFLDEWVNLYAFLTQKHGIVGIKAFSRTAFEWQLKVPGIVMFRAVHRGSTIGLHLWYMQGNVGYGHLGATSAEGYEFMASYALYWVAIEWLSQRVRWLDLGGGAGLTHALEDGLTQFKQGWATGTQPAYLCGRVFNRKQYIEMVKAKNIPETDYFPAYRKGEFA